MTNLSILAETQVFQEANKSEQAEMLVWFLHTNVANSEGVSIVQVNEAFDQLSIARANRTRLKEKFRVSRAIRTISQGIYAPAREFAQKMERVLPQSDALDEQIASLDQIMPPPFIPAERLKDLRGMIRAYAHLFLLENSMRALIENVLSKKLGPDWWEKTANASMMRKHTDREDNEKKKKWAPTRADFGPLYALDWPDLITIFRKFEADFEPIIKDIKFLHRFEDLGSFRNVVAHNGVIRESDDYTLLRIYYSDWIKQIG